MAKKKTHAPANTSAVANEALNQSLQETVNRFEKISNCIPGIIYQFKRSADGHYSVPYCSNALYQLFKISPDEVRDDATVLFEMIDSADYADVICSIESSAQNLTPWQFVYRIRSEKSGVHWLEGNAIPERTADGSTLWHGFVADITERKQAELALRESEERSNLCQEYGGIGLWENDLVNGKQMWSRSMQTLGFAARKNPRWQDFIAIVHPDDREKVIAAHQNHLKYGAKYEVEYRAILADGTVRWMRSSGKAQFTPDGRPVKFRGIVQDITVTKQTSEALSLNRSRLRFLLSNAPVTLYTCEVTPPYKSTYISPNVIDILGYSAEQFLETDDFWAKNIHPDDVVQIFEQMPQLFKNDKVLHEYRFRHADGSYRWIYDEVRLLRNGTGEVREIIGFWADITQRKHTEIELQRREAQYRAIVEDQNELICRYLPNGKLTFVNGAYARYYKKSAEELINSNYIPQIPEPDLTEVLAKLAQISQQHPLVHYAHRIITPSGETRWQQWIQRGIFAEDGSLIEYQAVGSDIEEHKQAELALKRSEEKFRAIIELSPIPKMLCDMQRKIIFLGPAFTKTFGYELTDIPTVEEWYAKAYPDSEYRQQAVAGCKALLEQVELGCEKAPEMEGKICCKDGTIKDVLISLSVATQIDGKLYLVSLYDITERKRHESELKNNRRFNALIEAIPDAILFKDGAGRWLIVNETVKQIFQLHNIPWQGKTDIEIAALHPEFQTAHQQCFESDEQAWEARKLNLCFETIETEDHQQRHFEVRKVPLFDEQGQRQALVIIGRDITEQKNTNQQLNQLALAVEQSPESIMITNLDAQIEYVNNAFIAATGYSRTEVYLQNPRFLQSGKTSEETYRDLWKTLSEGYSWKGEFINRRKDGSEYIEFAIIAPLRDANGRITHYVAVKEDVTEKKLLGEELDQYRYHLEELIVQRTSELVVAKENADQANQAKSEFLANMSHEIRTPMNAILGFSEILTQLITDPTQRHYLDAIHRSGKTLLHLINDILDLSKIEARKVTLQYKPVSLRAVLEDMLIIFSQKAAEKSLDFSIVIDEKLPETLLLDEIRLRQILLNIVGNAIKFTNEGFVSLAVVANFSTEADKLELVIAVYDTGIGIPDQQKEKVFAAFTQQDNQNPIYEGTGLGLAICKRLLELMGGTISIESEVGHGSCFTLTLSNVEVVHDGTAIKHESLAAIRAARFQLARILLVDDKKFNRLLITSYLFEFDELAVTEAETSEEALDLVRRQYFDLILMDRRLPDMDGDRVCQQIKAIPECANVPIIMISASVIATPDFQHQHFYDLELRKPVSKWELLAALQKFLPFEELTQQADEETVVTEEAGVCNCTSRQELAELLTFHYLPEIEKISQKGGFEINKIIAMTEQLLIIAEQYHCKRLEEWASNLKQQALLFDVTMLAKSLKGFSALIDKINGG